MLPPAGLGGQGTSAKDKRQQMLPVCFCTAWRIKILPEMCLQFITHIVSNGVFKISCPFSYNYNFIFHWSLWETIFYCSYVGLLLASSSLPHCNARWSKLPKLITLPQTHGHCHAVHAWYHPAVLRGCNLPSFSLLIVLLGLVRELIYLCTSFLTSLWRALCLPARGIKCSAFPFCFMKIDFSALSETLWI